MKLLTAGMLVLTSSCLLAQSKKELIAEVNRLKTENYQLKNPKEVELTDTLKKASYGLGTYMATQLKSQGAEDLSVEALIAGIRDIYQNKTPKIAQEEAMNFVQAYMQQAMVKKSQKVKDDGTAFLESNKAKEGVKVTASGLQYKVLKSGAGKTPTATSNVTVHYTGKLMDGTVFDSSEGGEPASFGVGQVIPGWTEALQLMKEGDKWTVFIPYELGYGERGAGNGQIPPFAVLIFDVELIKVN